MREYSPFKGINEALRVSINPIRSLLKEKNDRVKGLQSKDHDDLSECNNHHH